MTTQHARQLEQFVAVLDDADAWDALAREGWRLVHLEEGWETWERDDMTLVRARATAGATAGART